MPSTKEQVECPRNPEHGMVAKRLLAPDERQMATKAGGDVFEIDCSVCGKYEHPAPIDPHD